MDKTLGLLAIARKGGRLVCGEEQVGGVARAGRARLVLLASDAGAATARRVGRFVANTAQPLLTLPYAKQTLGGALGVSECAVCAVTDVRLARAVAGTLDGESYGERYGELLRELDERVRRVELRRAEKKPGAHRAKKQAKQS